MSMNGNARRTIDTLVALDFRLDDDASRPGVRVYWHPNDPTRRVKVFNGISDIAAKKVRNLASEIAGLSSVGERIPSSVPQSSPPRSTPQTAAIWRGSRATRPSTWPAS